MGKLFGTDGIRGVANRDITAELASRVGRAGAGILSGEAKGCKLVIGRDTRISGDMLEAGLVAGILSAGVDVLNVGIMPTPAVAYLTRRLGAQGGVVISASHNPVEDNGIKFFGPSGYKLSDDEENEIENCMERGPGLNCPVGSKLGRVYQVENAGELYVDFIKETVNTRLDGLKVVVDCANGAAYSVSPRALQELGAEVVAINNIPDGVNINDLCGSTHPESLQEAVVNYGAHLGLAHDGDADRVLAVTAEGELIDGDQIMVICARHLKNRGILTNNTVVVTVMSNLGLHLALRESGINVRETKVGDRYVLEECLLSGATFGGEQSGHILFLDHNSTGDGLLTGLHLLSIVKETGISLGELAGQMEKLPQILKNVRVQDKDKVMQSPLLADVIKMRERSLAGQGRILVRPSGTEPLVRVMVEGRDLQEIESIVQDVCRVIKNLS